MSAALVQLRIDDDAREELEQLLRARILAPLAASGAQLAQYRGRGDLGQWLRAVAIRAGIDLLRARKRERPVSDDALFDRALGAHADPELELMKTRYRSDFRHAVRDALGQLESPARSDLRLYYIDELKLTEMASLHHVTPSAVSRRIAKARQQLLDATRRVMRAQLGVTDTDLDSILGLIASRLELSESAFAEQDDSGSEGPGRDGG